MINKLYSIIYNHLNDTPISIMRLKDNRQTYKLKFNGGLNIRLDIGPSAETIRLQEVLIKNKIRLPKIIKVTSWKNQKKRDVIFKYSEWIEGVLLIDVWNLKDTFIKSGMLYGKMNSIKDIVTNNNIINTEFSYENAIWDNKDIIIIDHGRLKALPDIDIEMAKMLLKRIRNKDRIIEFLNGYSNFRTITGIMENIEKLNWFWCKGPMNNLPKLI